MNYEYNGIPGPYHYHEGLDAYTHIVRDKSGNKIICQLRQDNTGPSEATARLFAASPLLLSALIAKSVDGAATALFKRATTAEKKLAAAIILLRKAQGVVIHPPTLKRIEDFLTAQNNKK
jgi:hypothetical protein